MKLLGLSVRAELVEAHRVSFSVDCRVPADCSMIHLIALPDMQADSEFSCHLTPTIPAETVRSTSKYSMDGLAPMWWAQNFNPLWKPLVQWLRRQRHMTLSEFQLITTRIPNMTSIEKTIIISAFIAYKNMQP